MKSDLRKRLIAGLIAMLFTFAIFPSTLFAATQTISVRLEVDKTSAKIGDQFTVKVYMDNPIPISTLQYHLEFDPTAFTYKSRQYGPWLAESGFSGVCNVPEDPGNEVRLGAYDGSGNGDFLLTGLLITLTFEVKDTAEAGYTPFNVTHFDFANGTRTIDYGNRIGVSDITVNDSQATNVGLTVDVKRLRASLMPTTTPSVYGTLLSGIALNGGSVVPKDALDTTAVTGTWAWKTPSTLPTVGNSGYVAVFTPDTAFSNYEPLEVNVTPSITAKAVTAVVDLATKIFGQANPTFTATCAGLVSPDTINVLGLTLSSAATATSNVGQYNVISSTGTGVNGNYNVTVDGTNKLSITQAAAQSITTSIPAQVNKTAYEARNCANISDIATLAGLPSTVEVTTDGGNATLPITWAATPSTIDSKGATYSFTGTPTGNLNIGNGGLTKLVTVVIAPIDVTKPLLGDEIAPKGTKTAATAADLPQLLPTSGSVTVEGQSIAYTINWNGGETLDLTVPEASTTFTGTISYTGLPSWLTLPTDTSVSRKITVADKTIVAVTLAKPSDVTYGQEVVVSPATAPIPSEPPVFVYTYSGTPYDNSGEIVDSTTKPTKAGTYTVTATIDMPAFAGSASQDFIINRKPITATVNAASKVYGQANPAFSAAYGEFAYSETASVLTALTLTSAATVTSNVGSYDVTSSTGVGNNGNYVVTLEGTNKLTITKKAITVVADNASRDYLAANPTFTFTHNATDLVGTDTAAALAVTLSTATAASANAGTYANAITGTSASTNYTVTVTPGTLTINKINQSTPVTVTLSKTAGIVGFMTGVTATAAGGNSTGAYVYASSNPAVATINTSTGAITIVGAGTTQITATRNGDTNYNAQVSAPATLTVSAKMDLKALNTSASGAHLVNAKNQGKVSFGAVTRDGESNNFKLTINGNERLESYASVSEAQGEGCWVGILVGKIGENDITNLYVKTSSTYFPLAAADVEEARNAGGDGSTFVWWVKVTDSGAGSSHVIYVSTDGTDANAARLTVSFVPVVKYTVEVTSRTGGSATGGGVYNNGSTATVTATSNTGYKFDGWYKDGNRIYSGTQYSFRVTEDITLEARFKSINQASESGSYGGGGSGVLPSPTPEPDGKITDDTKDTATAKTIIMKIGNVNYTVNGVTRKMDVAPFIQDDRTYVPIRFVAEALGANVSWDAANRIAKIVYLGKTLELEIGKLIPGTDMTPFIRDDRTFVPIRYVMEFMGATVNWDEATRTIDIVEKTIDIVENEI